MTMLLGITGCMQKHVSKGGNDGDSDAATSSLQLLDEFVHEGASAAGPSLDSVTFFFGGINCSKRWHVDAACFLFWALL